MLVSAEAIIDGAVSYGGLTLIHGTVLALITWLLSLTLFRRCRPSVQAALWTIVLIKFLLPPVFPGEMALSGWIAKAASRVSVTRNLNIKSLPETGEQPRPINVVHSERISTANVLFAGYLFFIVLLSARALQAHKRNRRRISSLPAAGPVTQNEVDALAEGIGLKLAPKVRSTSREMTPYVFGCRQTFLVLPERLMQILEPSERRALILHELAHIRRRDILVRGLQGMTGILFFFFPPVLWVSRRVEYFTEAACDRWALAVSEVDPSAYANALVKVVKEMGRMPQPQLGLPLLRSTRLLEARLRAVLRDGPEQSPRLSSRAKIVLAGWSLFVLMGGATVRVSQTAAGVQQSAAGKVEQKSSLDTSSKEFPTRGSSKRVDPARALGSPERPEPPQSKSLARRATIESGETAIRSRLVEDSLQGATSLSTRKTLTPYEEGYLSGARYAQEQANRSRTNEAEPPVRQPSGHELKREIELRAQGLARPPVNR